MKTLIALLVLVAVPSVAIAEIALSVTSQVTGQGFPQPICQMFYPDWQACYSALSDYEHQIVNNQGYARIAPGVFTTQLREGRTYTVTLTCGGQGMTSVAREHPKR